MNGATSLAETTYMNPAGTASRGGTVSPPLDTAGSPSRTCAVCAAKTSAYDCMCEEGCGWAPIEKRCISGTPDYPSDQNVHIVQWTTKGCPGKSCSRDGPKWQCYSASYNEKKAFGSSTTFSDRFAVLPATSFPATHPKIALDGRASVSTMAWPPPYLGATETWYPHASLWDTATNLPAESPSWTAARPTNSGVAFFAYGYPTFASSNSGSEACGSMVTYMVQDSSCSSYILVLIDKAGCGKGGYVKIDMKTTGVVGDPIAFQNDPHADAQDPNSVLAKKPSHPDATDSYTWNAAAGNGTATMEWDAWHNDGFVVGPLTYANEWSVNFKVQAYGSSGRTLETFKIGTYDAHMNEVGFVEANIKKATHDYGGLEYKAEESTSWCQHYSDCGSCTMDEQCTFYDGNCISEDAYVYNFGCTPVTAAPITNIMAREADALERESKYDGFLSGAVVRFSYDAPLDMTCPCSTRYRYHVTVYSNATMTPIFQVDNVPLRLNAAHTFVDLPHDRLTDGESYRIHSHLCIEQGTLARDECSNVAVDYIKYDHASPPPPPSPPSTPPPPFPPA